MIYGKGLHRSPPEKVAHRLGAHSLLDLGQTPRGAASLEPCPRIDQGHTSTCHAASAAGAIWTAFNAKGRPLGFVPSQLQIASTTYALTRAQTHAGPQLPTLVDDGSQLQDDATAMARYGICPMGPLQNGRFCDVPNGLPGVPFPEPSISDLQIAGANIIGGEYTIEPNADAPRTVALCLDVGIPVWVGGEVDMAYERLGPNDIAQPAAGGSGHAQYLSAYRTNAAGKFEYLVQGSWGKFWAADGAVWASEEWLISMWSIWPMRIAE